jgi:hypothetical protein
MKWSRAGTSESEAHDGQGNGALLPFENRDCNFASVLHQCEQKEQENNVS